MADEGPLVLKLAPLPRNQIGPFLILGVDKDASKEVIEAAWAQRLIWARKGQFTIPLEDINWARTILRTWEGTHLFIPNSDLQKGIFFSYNYGDPKQRCRLEIGAGRIARGREVVRINLVVAADHKQFGVVAGVVPHG